MPQSAYAKIIILLLVTLAITFGLLMYSVDLFIGNEGCFLACLSAVQWVVLAFITLGATGCAVLLILLPGYSDLAELERHSQSRIWWIFLVVCLLLVILGLNFFLFPSYQPVNNYAPKYWVLYEFLQPLAALAVVYGGAGIAILLILRSVSQSVAKWTIGTVVQIFLLLAAAVFVGQYLLSLIWGAIFYLV